MFRIKISSHRHGGILGNSDVLLPSKEAESPSSLNHTKTHNRDFPQMIHHQLLTIHNAIFLVSPFSFGERKRRLWVTLQTHEATISPCGWEKRFAKLFLAAVFFIEVFYFKLIPVSCIYLQILSEYFSI
jgi:hypothetical protein